jgi:hypothetical protein
VQQIATDEIIEVEISGERNSRVYLRSLSRAASGISKSQFYDRCIGNYNSKGFLQRKNSYVFRFKNSLCGLLAML